MSKSLIVSSGAAVNTADNTTRFMPITGIPAVATSEASYEATTRSAGIFSNLFSYVTANTTLVTSTITLRKSRSDTSVTVTYTSGQTGIKEDTSNTASFANTDEIDHEVTVANDTSGTTNLSVSVLGIQFDPSVTTDCMTDFGCFLTNSFASANARIIPTGTVQQVALSETTGAKYRIRNSFVTSNLFSTVINNSQTGGSTFTMRTRKNGANGNQSVVWTGGATGQLEDTSNSDTLAVGDDYNYDGVRSGAGSIDVTSISTMCLSTNNIFPLLAGAGGTTTQIAFNNSRYFGISGHAIPTSTESSIQIYPRFDFTAKELECYLDVNNITTSATVVALRVNSSNSALTISIAAGATGVFSDTTNSVSIALGSDEINYIATTPNTSGNISLRWISILGETASTPVVNNVFRRRIRKFF